MSWWISSNSSTHVASVMNNMKPLCSGVAINQVVWAWDITNHTEPHPNWSLMSHHSLSKPAGDLLLSKWWLESTYKSATALIYSILPQSLLPLCCRWRVAAWWKTDSFGSLHLLTTWWCRSAITAWLPFWTVNPGFSKCKVVSIVLKESSQQVWNFPLFQSQQLITAWGQTFLNVFL